jgi:hypothetical protein
VLPCDRLLRCYHLKQVSTLHCCPVLPLKRNPLGSSPVWFVADVGLRYLGYAERCTCFNLLRSCSLGFTQGLGQAGLAFECCNDVHLGQSRQAYSRRQGGLSLLTTQCLRVQRDPEHWVMCEVSNGYGGVGTTVSRCADGEPPSVVSASAGPVCSVSSAAQLMEALFKPLCFFLFLCCT